MLILYHSIWTKQRWNYFMKKCQEVAELVQYKNKNSVSVFFWVFRYNFSPKRRKPLHFINHTSVTVEKLYSVNRKSSVLCSLGIAWTNFRRCNLLMFKCLSSLLALDFVSLKPQINITESCGIMYFMYQVCQTAGLVACHQLSVSHWIFSLCHVQPAALTLWYPDSEI